MLTLEAGGQKMLSSEYLTDRTCKMKQYLNDMLIIINQIILAIVRTFLISSKYLKDRSCKMKQYLNYILMIINQNILAILRTFLNLQKKIMKNSTPSELSQLLLLNLFRKFLTERKYLMNTLIFVRLKYL